MQNECEIYVDPEEDEVFFGCVSEREKFVSAKLVNGAGSILKDDCSINEIVRNDEEENVENKLRNERSGKVLEEIFLDDSSESKQPQTEVKEEKRQDSCKIHSNNNTSVELEHNYSTPMKHKIDKSILATPKSVVKADRDGGFLKVLSEIALVKAEAEGNKKSEEEEDDKENKQMSQVPEVKITEATPEKGTMVASPPKSGALNTEMRRFRIIYSSPQKEEKTDLKSKSHVETFEEERNLKNKCLDFEKEKRKSVDLIDWTNEISNRERNKEEGERNNRKDMKPPGKLRFSREARKVVDVLKKSTADDTLNFTIPEIDVEEEENSFLSPEPVSGFDVTVIPNEMGTTKVQSEKSPPKILIKPAENKLTWKCQTVEKDRRNLTPVTSQSKLHTIKYFSERRIYNQVGSEGKSKCAKKLTLEEKKPTVISLEKGKGGAVAESGSSRIPVFNSKNLGGTRIAITKVTPSKTPSGKLHKNPKFNHIESPINAYIHNKPTSLVVNVKPEGKKDAITKVWKPQTSKSERKVQEKTRKPQTSASAVRLPFVEYKSASTLKIEKKPESRLPRLAPNVMKLIGTQSPKVLRHEGRYHVNTPKKETETENNCTLVADPREVSVVVSQTAQKSDTIK